MKNSKDYIVKYIGSKNTVWFKNSNNYIQMEESAFAVFEMLNNRVSTQIIEQYLYKQYKLNKFEGRQFVSEIKNIIENEKNSNNRLKTSIFKKNTFQIKYISTIKYQFKNKVFSFGYQNEDLKQKIHSLFAHLEVFDFEKEDFRINIYENGEDLFLESENIIIGKWNKEDDYLLKGKVFMELLNKAYNKKDNDWMTVLHASAVGNKKDSIIIAGESGDGKSTMTTILMSKGFSVLSDDFVPIDSETQNIFQFPISISIKKEAFDLISKEFPEIMDAEEFYFEKMNKVVRYLNPQIDSDNNKYNYPVKAIVFVKYKANVNLKLKRISNDKALEKLIPEAWISSLEINANKFLNWIEKMPCYELEYSNNDKMYYSIKKLFDDEL